MQRPSPPSPIRVVAFAAALLAPAAAASGQASLTAPAAPLRGGGARVDSVTVVPGARYAAGGLRRLLLGDHYRDLWGTPIRVPVLDLASFAGGLVPLRAHAGSQTRSLRFRGSDGRQYQFRSVFKTPTARLPEALQNTLVSEFLQDGASASHPVGALVVARLLRAVGVMYAEPHLVVMPDDPALGAFREDFAGMLGIIEERPNDEDEGETGGYGLAIKVIGPTRLFERIDESPADVVDAPAFLAARMVDILIGDRDRHRDNWRWALLDDRGPVRRWLPVSRDHDEAFVKLDGLLLGVARHYRPQLTSFGPTYDRTLNLNWHAREVDRRFLAGLDRAVWDSVAAVVLGRLSDQTLAEAVRALPPAMYGEGGALLESELISRAHGLVDELHRYYALLAQEVEIRATDADEIADIERIDGRFLRVRVRGKGFAEPWFDRRFDARETHEVRLALWGGADSVHIHGEGDAPIRLRVVGGKGADRFVDDSRAGGVRFYDSGDRTRLAAAPGDRLDTSDYPEWVGSDLDRYPPRDWGAWTRVVPVAGFDSDYGLLVGGGVARTRFGFRKQPHASEVTLAGGVSSGDGTGMLQAHADLRQEGTRPWLEVDAALSDIDVIRFHGFGNDTPGGRDDTFYHVELPQLDVAAALVRPLGATARLRVGGWLRGSEAHTEASNFFASLADTLYGAGRFVRAGLEAAVERDTRDEPVAPEHGTLLRMKAGWAPPVLDTRSAWYSLEGEARGYVTPWGGARPATLALRVAGWWRPGALPFQESVFLGGGETLRGWGRNRFAGDGALLASADARITLGGLRLLLPSRVGVVLSGDAGRVFADGASRGGWHTSLGGGVWIAVIDRSHTLSLTWSRGAERAAVRAGVGFTL